MDMQRIRDHSLVEDEFMSCMVSGLVDLRNSLNLFVFTEQFCLKGAIAPVMASDMFVKL